MEIILIPGDTTDFLNICLGFSVFVISIYLAYSLYHLAQVFIQLRKSLKLSESILLDIDNTSKQIMNFKNNIITGFINLFKRR